MSQPVSLQINLAPGDYPHVRYLLPHQLKILAAQVDEVILNVDAQPGKGRFAQGWEKYRLLLDDFLANEIQPLYKVKIIPVDYAEQTRERVAEMFFGEKDIPAKDFRGGPYYAYFYGLYSTSNDLVFHLDSDIFLGGASQKWVAKAVETLNSDPSCLIVSPLPGPPHPDDILIGQAGAKKIGPYRYTFNGMSTRIFMMDKAKLIRQKLSPAKPSFRNQLKAIIEGNSNADLPEHILSSYMIKNNLKRIDFSGTGDGLWSLHPPYRTEIFYNTLPELIKKIETGNIPEQQYGFYDMVDEMCDWTDAREKLKQNRWWKRVLK